MAFLNYAMNDTQNRRSVCNCVYIMDIEHVIDTTCIWVKYNWFEDMWVNCILILAVTPSGEKYLDGINNENNINQWL